MFARDILREVVTTLDVLGAVDGPEETAVILTV